MARGAVLAAGGIVLRREPTPLIAVVRLRKRDEWVLPKGKLDDGETPLAAAEREVIEETGHDVTVHEFLGTLVYEINGRSKVVHYWRMEACGGQAYELMNDIRAVDWLPLDAALERLSRTWERAFLANVGPQALLSLSIAAKAKVQAKARAVPKRRRRSVAAPALPRPAAAAVLAAEVSPVELSPVVVSPVEVLPAEVLPAEILPAEVLPAEVLPAPVQAAAADLDAIASPAGVACESAASDAVAETLIVTELVLEAPLCDGPVEMAPVVGGAPEAEAPAPQADVLDCAIDAGAAPAAIVEADAAPANAAADDRADRGADSRGWSLARKVRDWFGRAA